MVGQYALSPIHEERIKLCRKLHPCHYQCVFIRSHQTLRSRRRNHVRIDSRRGDTHLLRVGVDINTIRAWLGHVSINTTNVYAETDLEMKAKALGLCAVESKRPAKHWRDNQDLMSFLAQI